jgi:molecular chaperone DnaK (HSP70)
MNWPGLLGSGPNLCEKVPSAIAYLDENPDDTGLEWPAGYLWGYQVKPSFVSCSGTKLLLEQEVDHENYDGIRLVTSENSYEKGFLRLPPGKTAGEVVADYLRKLYEHGMATLEKNSSAAHLSVTPIEFWFTIPAIWPDRTRNATIKAAKQAGFGSRPGDTISVIPESEAGVVAALKLPTQITKEAFTVCSLKVITLYQTLTSQAWYWASCM